MTNYDHEILLAIERRWLDSDEIEPVEPIYICGCCGHEEYYGEAPYYDKVDGEYICSECIDYACKAWEALYQEEIDEVTCDVCGKKTGKEFAEYKGKNICFDCFADRIENFEVKKEWR